MNEVEPGGAKPAGQELAVDAAIKRDSERQAELFTKYARLVGVMGEIRFSVVFDEARSLVMVRHDNDDDLMSLNDAQNGEMLAFAQWVNDKYPSREEKEQVIQILKTK